MVQKMREAVRALRRHSLLENTVMLYVLQFSTMALGMVTQGYQQRVLGMEMVGTLGAAQYTTNFFQIFIDFGFILSATAKASRYREDKEELGRVLSRVIAAKGLFIGASAAVLLGFICPRLADGREALAYLFYLFSVAMMALLPDFLYRGIEQMAAITVRAVAIKVFATVMVFLFVREPGDYYRVPLFTALGNAGALAFVYWHLYRKVGVRFRRVSPRSVWDEIRESSQFFLAKAANAVNANLNGVLLKQITGSASAGMYTNADRVIAVARNGMSPIADSLYPHMMKHRNFSIVKKALLFVYPVILAGCAAVFVFAKPLLVLWLGPEGEQVAAPLRLLMPVAVFCFPNYVLGHPTLGAMGLVKYANMSVVFGTAVYLLGAGLAYFAVGINWVSLCLLSSVTEFSILVFRVAVIVKNRKLLKSEAQEEPAER